MSIAGSLLCLVGTAQANQADDEIYRLIAQARQRAAAHSFADIAETLLRLSELLGNASMESVTATTNFMNDIDRLRFEEQGQTVRPARMPNPGIAAPKPPHKPSAPGFSVPSNRPAPPFLEQLLTLPPPPAADMLTEALSPASPPIAPASIPLTRETSSQNFVALLDLLRRRGDAAFRRGDISAARLLYERGANTGCGACAEALAQTYDADHLHRMGIMRIVTDPVQAEAWRARARQLGQTGTPR